MNICVVRHGETKWNKEGLRQGRKDIPLNDVGVRQAEEIGEKLRFNDWKRIISSPLCRARKTAEIIAQVLKIDDIELDNNLIERAYGTLEGKAYEFLPDKGENVESKENALQRIEKAFHDAIERYYPADIIIVSHGCVIKLLLEKITGEVYNTHIKNGNMQIISFNNGKMNIMEDDQ